MQQKSCGYEFITFGIVRDTVQIDFSIKTEVEYINDQRYNFYKLD